MDAWLQGLSAPAIRALRSAGIDNVAALHQHTEKQLLALHGFGPGAIKRLTLNDAWPPKPLPAKD